MVMMRGFVSSARPITSICCSPPESLPAAPLRRSASTGKSSSTRLKSASIWPRSRRIRVPKRRFSSTLSVVKTCRPSGTWEMPRRATASGVRPAMELPSKAIVPLVGRNTPEMVSNVVDLPAPLGPTTQTISPSPTPMEMPRTAGTLP